MYAAVLARRRAAALAVLLAVRGGGQGPRGKKSKDASPFIWADHVDRLTEAEFKLRYRLDADSFYTLLDMVRAPLAAANAQQATWTAPSPSCRMILA